MSRELREKMNYVDLIKKTNYQFVKFYFLIEKKSRINAI